MYKPAMNIAFLFNSDHSAFGGYYVFPIMERILVTGVLQKTNRHMRVSVGDILTYGHASTWAQMIQLCEVVYKPKTFDRLIHERLSETYGKATVFCWLFQNMSNAIADSLHTALANDPAYLGAMDVDFSNPIQLQLFRNSLMELYRLQGKNCAMFYEMGSNEDPDLAVRQELEQNGFSVAYEDIGARRTIFDNFDSVEHFRRVADFIRVFASLPGMFEERACDLVLTLEELHPKLFDSLAAAARVLERAETEEDLAQAALSGRRSLEKIADYLFPPQTRLWKDRKVGRSEYKNRLWAYLEQTLEAVGIKDQALLLSLGTELDRLIEFFNAGLHANPTREKVEGAFRDLAFWLCKVIEISPSEARKPYLAYEDGVLKFVSDFLEDLG